MLAGGTPVTVSFPSLQASLGTPWGAVVKKRRRFPPPVQLFALQVWHRYQGQRQPGADDAVAAAALAADMVRGEHQRQAIPRDTAAFVAELQAAVADLARTAGTEISPICAVTGGMLGQEIIKAISAKNEPFNNWFFFDGISGNGRVWCVPNAAK